MRTRFGFARKAMGSGHSIFGDQFGRARFKTGGEGGSGGAGGGDDGGDDDGGGDGKPFMTFATQADYDAAIAQRIARETKKREKIERELEQLKGGGDKDKGDKDSSKDKGDGEKRYSQAEVEALIAKARETELNPVLEENTRLKSTQKENAILKAAGSAFSPDQVVKLLRDDIGFDDHGNLVVVDGDGSPKLNSKGKPISVEAYVGEYLEANKHLVKGSGKSGMDSSTKNSTQAGGGNERPKTWNDANSQLANLFRKQ